MMKKVLVTAGPTYEPIDPVRFIGNRSSGKQGVAIAKAFADDGWNVQLTVGPISELLLQNLPQNINIHRVQTAEEMLKKSLENINVDVAIHNAAVSDYRVENPYLKKIKKEDGFSFNSLKFVENSDILYTFGHSEKRPKLVIGFAAETENFIENGQKKLLRKNADFIMINDVSDNKVFGKDKNKLIIVGKNNFIYETDELDKYLIGKEIIKLVNKNLRL
ncbi:MAG: phosphopantothenoylcysteine decarboxylase [Rickettsiales bacterium]|nr:phosphopantothenoylcysteine decarboxylase [Rickettsiales bacterium]